MFWKRASLDTQLILRRIAELRHFMAGEIQGLQDELAALKVEVGELQREASEENAILDSLAAKLDAALAGQDLSAVAAAVEEFKAERAKIAAVRTGLDETGTRDTR